MMAPAMHNKSSHEENHHPHQQHLNSNNNNNNDMSLNEQAIALNGDSNIIYYLMQTPTDLTNMPVNNNNNNNNISTSLKIKAAPLSPKSPRSSTPPYKQQIFSPNESASSFLIPLNSANSPHHSSGSSSPSLNYGSGSGIKGVREERRRASHNQVERRRRDNINKWIVELSKVIPDCSYDQTKHGQSKGGILEKTVQYLCEMKYTNQQLTQHIQGVKSENDSLRQQNELFKKENKSLKSQLAQMESSSSKHQEDTITSNLCPTDINNNNSTSDQDPPPLTFSPNESSRDCPIIDEQQQQITNF